MGNRCNRNLREGLEVNSKTAHAIRTKMRARKPFDYRSVSVLGRTGKHGYLVLLEGLIAYFWCPVSKRWYAAEREWDNRLGQGTASKVRALLPAKDAVRASVYSLWRLAAHGYEQVVAEKLSGYK